MKVNYLLNDIMKSSWLLDYRAHQEYKILLDKLLSGQAVFNHSENFIPLKLYDHTGSELSTSSSKKEIIGAVNMIGMMVKYSGMCISGTDTVLEQLKESDSHPDTKGTILRIDGPGTSVPAVSPLLEFKKNKKKPIVGLCDSALSGHYWTAVGVCDYIIAENTISSTFGSVRVVLSISDFSEKRKKEGIIDHDIYPSESEDKNKVFHLALKGEYDQIKKEMLSPIAIKFQEAVKENRPKLIGASGVLTGKTFYAEEALKLGMIDSIGNFNDAVQMVYALAELQDFNNI